MSIVVFFDELSDLNFSFYWAKLFSSSQKTNCVFYLVSQKNNKARDVDLSGDNLVPSETIEYFKQNSVEGYKLKVVGKGEIRHTKALKNCLVSEKADLLLLTSNQSNYDLMHTLYEKSHKASIILSEREIQPETALSKVLLPTSGGPNAHFALQLMNKVANINECVLVPAFVEQNFGEYALGVGESFLKKFIKKAGLADASNVQPKVLVSRGIKEALLKEANQGYDLVLVGGTHRGFVHRTLFNTLPEYLMQSEKAVTVGVAKNSEPITSLWRRGVESWLDVTVPQLNRDERILLFEKIEGGSVWNFDFMALITLATAIASLGLMQNSGAVVIGAMLVAPLMTPILGVGLSLVHGKLPLLNESIKSILLGFLLALFVGFTLGHCVNIPELTDQLLARCSPTLVDLLIALLSGLAAAHCLARPNLSAALPGVAIAAALVPPIATVGISLALGEIAKGLGAALLFGTNVAAIILGASISFYSAGLRGATEMKVGGKIVIRIYAALFLLVLVFMVPLGKKYLDDFIKQSAQVAEMRQITKSINEMPFKNVLLKSVKVIGDNSIELELISDTILNQAYLIEVKGNLKSSLNKDYKVSVNYTLHIPE